MVDVYKRQALGDEEKTQEALKQCVSAAEELAEVILGRAGAEMCIRDSSQLCLPYQW